MSEIELFEHQRMALSLLRLNDGFALYMEQGTGKTFPALFRLAELAASGRASSALIVAPKAVCESWVDKVGLLSNEQQAALSSIRFEVVSYDLVWRRPEYAEGQWDAVVLDESHYIKTPSTRRTRACLKLCSRAKYRYELTGTPTSNGQLCNLWSQLAAIDPVVERGLVRPACFDGLSYTGWLERYAYLNQYHKPYRYKNVSEVQEAMGSLSYRVTKEECLDLPEKMPDELWRVELPKAAKGPYRQMARDSAIIDPEVLADNPLVRSLRLRQIASGFLETDGGETVEYGTAKLSALGEFLDDFERKLVVFCEFRHSIDAVSNLLAKRGWDHVVLDGRQADKGIWRRFQCDPKVRAIVCQYQSGSAGIDLFAADTCVFFEPTRSSNLLEQARDRIHRVGQRRACSYYHLLCQGTIEVAMHRALSNYHDFDEALFTRYLDDYTKGERL